MERRDLYQVAEKYKSKLDKIKVALFDVDGILTDGKLYYRHSDGKYYYLGRDVASSNFKNNRLDKKFIITSPFKLNFTSRSGWRVSSKEMEIYYPTQLIADEVSKL